jgi:DnaJ-class molecular chaperone
MTSWAERKEQRRDYYRRYVLGWKLVTCTACNGSGRYDHNGSPPCGSCDGTGKERVQPTPKDQA